MVRFAGRTIVRAMGAAAGVVALGTTYLAMPPPHQLLQASRVLEPAPAVRGVVHVHSNRSDGTGDVEAIAAAASRAGLQFVVLTDHGDGRRSPAAPRYLSGVLCIDGLEISTNEGHLVALGLDRTSYTLGGDARGVAEDIARWGGFSIVAHSDSAKPELRWTDWESSFDGIEWLNGDSEWRDEGIVSLARTLATYWFRGPESLASLQDRPPTLDRWDRLTRTRSIVALAGSDAHARLGIGGIGEPYANGLAVPLPSYERIFQTFSITVHGVLLSGDARDDAGSVLAAIRQGRLFSTIDGIATPGQLAFSAAIGSRTATMGETIEPGGPVTLTAETNAPEGAVIRIIKDGSVVLAAPGPRASRTESAEPATYRIEVEMPDSPGDPHVPWLVSNPIYVRSRPTTVLPTQTLASAVTSLYSGGPAAGWEVERSARSQGALDTASDATGTQMAFRYALGGTASESPFAAIAIPLAGATANSGIRLRARASHPMRVSVQLRVPNGAGGQRWRGSVYLDDTLRTVTVPFRTMHPTETSTSDVTIPLADVRSVLIVVDHVHTPLGTSGRIWIDELALIREAQGTRP